MNEKLELIDVSSLGHDFDAMEQSHLDTIAALQRAVSRGNGAFRALHIHASKISAALAESEKRVRFLTEENDSLKTKLLRSVSDAVDSAIAPDHAIGLE